jgi:3-methyladenine DNA glycosylase Tag
MRLAPEDLEEVRRIAMSFETSDEMVAELKKRMGIDAPPPILWTTDRSF